MVPEWTRIVGNSPHRPFILAFQPDQIMNQDEEELDEGYACVRGLDPVTKAAMEDRERAVRSSYRQGVSTGITVILALEAFLLGLLTCPR